MTEPASVIGLGNIEKKDDGIGVLLVEALREELATGAWKPEGNRDIALIPAGIDSLLAAAHAASNRWVILVDAARMGLAAGEYRVFAPGQAAMSSRDGGLSPHDADLAETLRLIDSLGCAGRVRIMGIQGEDMGDGRGLSRQLQARVAEMQNRIKEEVGQLP
ncbi:MAG TPA: hydrogenase maturation protease [Spirochaetia bacterium]|nr:hydrogenase maturation protease [Spirochaetia bacterium]